MPVEYPIYYETYTETVKLLSRYKAITVHVQSDAPTIQYIDSELVSQQSRIYEAGAYLRLITAEEFNDRYYISLNMLTALNGVITRENGEIFKWAVGAGITLQRIKTTRPDRYKYRTLATVTLTTDAQSYDGILELVVNRFGEIKTGTLWFESPLSVEYGFISSKVGVMGYVHTNKTPNQITYQQNGGTLSPDWDKSYLYIYAIGSGDTNAFDSGFNDSFD